MRRPLLYDHARGVFTDFIVSNDGSYRWETRQNTTPILESNKRRQGRRHFRGTQDHMRHVAEIPSVLWHIWAEDMGDPRTGDPEVQKRWTKRLNDPEWRFLRVDDGKL